MPGPIPKTTDKAVNTTVLQLSQGLVRKTGNKHRSGYAVSSQEVMSTLKQYRFKETERLRAYFGPLEKEVLFEEVTLEQ